MDGLSCLDEYWFAILSSECAIKSGLKRRMQLAIGLPIVVTGVIASLIFQ